MLPGGQMPATARLRQKTSRSGVSSDEARAEWRARRAERRAKQRAANIVRAQKMHEARLEYEETQPPLLTNIGASTVRRDRKSRPSAFVGCSGWYYWHWRDSFYQGHPSSRWFSHYQSQFKTVELNAPFYSWPTLATLNTWIRQVSHRKFIYAIKVNELITHTKRFVGTAGLVKDFGLIADLLGPYFGCFLFQLPPSFHYTPAGLKRILKQLDPRRRNVVEFRHPSWWNETVYKAFRDTNTIFCSISGPRLPDELIKTADDVYIRFHGTPNWYRHDYTKEELSVWTARIRQSGARHVWAYFNNDREGYAIKNALELIRQLDRKDVRVGSKN
jgi:uncharacterized protein YecE (DUF72 family)